MTNQLPFCTNQIFKGLRLVSSSSRRALTSLEEYQLIGVAISLIDQDRVPLHF